MHSLPPTLLFLLLLLLLSSSVFVTVSTTPTTTTSTSSSSTTCSGGGGGFRSPCPPFTSPPSFPFSSLPGCGHPSFQINCTTPHSLISINNLSFAILSYDPNTTSLLLSPQPPPTTTTNCSSLDSLSIPSHSINLSGSPFHISDSSCSRLSVIKPCSPPNLTTCTTCPWQCKLMNNPLELLQDCGGAASHSHLSEQGCKPDFLGS